MKWYQKNFVCLSAKNEESQLLILSESTFPLKFIKQNEKNASLSFCFELSCKSGQKPFDGPVFFVSHLLEEEEQSVNDCHSNYSHTATCVFGSSHHGKIIEDVKLFL